MTRRRPAKKQEDGVTNHPEDVLLDQTIDQLWIKVRENRNSLDSDRMCRELRAQIMLLLKRHHERANQAEVQAKAAERKMRAARKELREHRAPFVPRCEYVI
jgi:hypothetical protein